MILYASASGVIFPHLKAILETTNSGNGVLKSRSLVGWHQEYIAMNVITVRLIISAISLI